MERNLFVDLKEEAKLSKVIMTGDNSELVFKKTLESTVILKDLMPEILKDDTIKLGIIDGPSNPVLFDYFNFFKTVLIGALIGAFLGIFLWTLFGVKADTLLYPNRPKKIKKSKVKKEKQKNQKIPNQELKEEMPSPMTAPAQNFPTEEIGQQANYNANMHQPYQEIYEPEDDYNNPNSIASIRQKMEQTRREGNMATNANNNSMNNNEQIKERLNRLING
ncbi:MAG: hypothetical protein GF347_05160 [Candidatus Moranbacteria bacterium]|nr:hypothetical protein [Candidatus Moranbacteria bacterium]